MKNPLWNRPLPRLLQSALWGGLLVGTAALAPAQSSSGDGDHRKNPIQSFSANPSTLTAGQTTMLSWAVDGVTNVTLSGVSATPDLVGGGHAHPHHHLHPHGNDGVRPMRGERRDGLRC